MIKKLFNLQELKNTTKKYGYQLYFMCFLKEKYEINKVNYGQLTFLTF